MTDLRKLAEGQIKHMVDRFLGWKLPADFAPDGGIEFHAGANVGTPYEYKREPIGTNLLTAIQAEAMVRYMLDGLHEDTWTEQELLDEIRRRDEIIECDRGLLADANAEIARLRGALSAACGYMRNAAIDLGTGAPKKTALATVEGGLKRAEAALGDRA